MFSVTILTKDCHETLAATLESLKDVPEIVILDTGSTDQTLEKAGEFAGVKIFKTEFKGFGPLHNEASGKASYDWILSIDSDEVVTAELLEEIRGLKLDPENVYVIERENYFKGKKIRGWSPDPVVRMYHRKKTRFSDDAVHERVLAEGLKKVRLKHRLKHTPYRSYGDFLEKMQKYSTLFAEQYQGKRIGSFSRALFHGLGAFLKSYFVKRGFLDGKEGFIISLYNSQTAYYKYLKLAELNKKN